MIGHRLTQHVLVERTGEVGVEKLTVADGLANHTTYEFEITEMFAVDPRLTR